MPLTQTEGRVAVVTGAGSGIGRAMVAHFVERGMSVAAADIDAGAAAESARLAGNFGGVFVGEKGWVTSMTTGGQIEGGPEDIFAAMNLKTREVDGGQNNHHANWLECIKTRETPNADVEIGHRSITVCHLVNITRELGRKLTWDPAKEQFENQAEAQLTGVQYLGLWGRRWWGGQ